MTILGNLLDNAVDAAQGSPHAKVTVTARAQDDTLLLRVTDTGPGVADGHADAVFEQGWSTKPAGPGGRGLGLALVQQSVARNSGTLTLAESPTGGAQFTVVLPLQRTSATTPTGGTA